MNVYQKYKDAQGRKTGPWFIKYPIGRDPLSNKIRYRIEKVGYQKKLAERAYQKKMVLWAEQKYLDVKEESNLTFNQLVEWYLNLKVVQTNKTFGHIERACRCMKEFFGAALVREIKPSMVEKYQDHRLQETTSRGKPRSAASVNREITVLNRMFNLAIREDLTEKNPCWKVKMLAENNVRDRILSAEELEILVAHLPRHAALIVQFAYWTGMRAGEIFSLTWDKVHLKEQAIKLKAADTKTLEPRVIFLSPEILAILEEAGKVRALEHNRVFTYKGKPIASIKTCFWQACRKAGIDNFRFHDLRHTFNTNMRKAGVAPSVIMKMTGHKTAAMFNRYNTVDLLDAQEAYRKLQEFLEQEEQTVNSGNSRGRAKKCSHSAP